MKSFRDPASVAVVGASATPGTWGQWLSRGALSGAHRREVFLVNDRHARLHDQPAFPTLSALPVVPELVVLAVPAARIDPVVDEALALGVGCFLTVTAGVEGEAHLLARVRAAGARMIGPNSLGLYDAAGDLQLAWGSFLPGSLAVISQSGQLGSEIAALSARAGLGISRFVSTGNQGDVTASELLEDLVEDDQTRVIGLYLESFSDGERLVRAISDLGHAGKQTVVLTTGGSDGSRRLARTHTGSLTSSLDTVDAACRAAGAIRVATPTELVDLARYVRTAQLPRGRRIAVVSDSGGQGGIAADLATAEGLAVPVLPAADRTDLADLLPPAGSIDNPVDLAGAGERALSTYADVCGRLLGSPSIDAVVLSGYFGCYDADSTATAAEELRVVDVLADLVTTLNTPLVVHSMSADSAAVARMWERGIPAYPVIESAVKATARAASLGVGPRRRSPAPVSVERPPEPGYWAGRGFVAELGIEVPPAVLVQVPEDLQVAAEQLQRPWVLKAGWLDHKTEVGGLATGLIDLDALRRAHDDMQQRLGDGPYVVEEQDERRHVVELLVGGRRDSDFGPLVVVGAGGTTTELSRDTSVELAPVDHQTARSMLQRLRCAPLLAGWRGSPALDVEAVVDAVVAVSRTIAQHPALTELEINPVRVGETGALAVDVLVVAV